MGHGILLFLNVEGKKGKMESTVPLRFSLEVKYSGFQRSLFSFLEAPGPKRALRVPLTTIFLGSIFSNFLLFAVPSPPVHMSLKVVFSNLAL